MSCGVGDTIKLYTIGGTFDLTIAGIIVEPTNGSSIMGWKQVFISDEDFDRFYQECKKNETEERSADFHILKVYKEDDSTLSDAKFKRQLNLDTGIVDNSTGSLTRELILHYVNLFPSIIASTLMVFIGFLMIVVLIVTGHSISMGIEMDYVNLGILKSQGFTKGKLRIVYVLQYLAAQLLGTLIGMMAAIPLTKSLGNVFQPITGILAENHISIGKSLAVMAAVLLVSGLFIIFVTRRAGNISPVQAISGGYEEIYFDSRLKAPIHQKALSPSLALRQFTSNKRQYSGIIMIVSILVFFMTTAMILGNVLNSKSAIESMGEIYTEVDVKFKKTPDDSVFEQLEGTIEQYTDIEKKYYLETKYLSVDGEELYCLIYKNPEVMVGISKGRAPLYDNEIVITDIVAEELNLKMGDKVTVSHENRKDEYMISGINQCMNDTGMCFAMSLEGAKKLGIENVYWGGYSISNPSKAVRAAKALNEKFSDQIEAQAIENSGADATFTVAVNAMKVVIYTFSVIFALVVVHMVCSKAFLREKTDIGIYKALGFSSSSLRIQFAVRFLIVAILGSVIGSIFSILFSGKILSSMLRVAGISSFAVEYSALTFLLPITLICFCFFLFSYIAARKIKRLEIKELVME